MEQLLGPLGEPVVVDAARERLRSKAEVDCAIYALLTFAFGERGSAFRRDQIRTALPDSPTVLEVVNAVFAARRRLGPIADEPVRRREAGMAMAAFLAVDPAALGLPAAMFRLGSDVWLTPGRPRPS